jgi:malate permease and related proteins
VTGRGKLPAVVILDLLAPIFVLIALGAFLNRLGLLPPELIGALNRLLYWVGLPVVVFHSLAVAERVVGRTGPLLHVLLTATAASVVLAWVGARVSRVSPSGRGTYVQAAFRGNLTFVGLPLILTVPGVPQAPAVLAMAPMLVMYNAVAVSALLLSQHEAGWRMILPVGRAIVRNPILLASVAGAVWHYAGWPLVSPVERSLAAVGQMALPLALLCIGGGLMTVPLRGNRRLATTTALHKVVVSPALGWLAARVFGLPPAETLAALLLLACPTAAVSYTMVKQMGGDEALAASGVVLSTVLAAPALALILAWFAV